MSKLTTLSLTAAFIGAVSMASLAIPAQAADPVKCYGIAKAGENDCASAAGSHDCAGMSEEHYDGSDFMLAASPHSCSMHGGQTEPFEGMNSKKG